MIMVFAFRLPPKLRSDRKRLFVRLTRHSDSHSKISCLSQLSLHFIAQDLPVLTTEHLKLNCPQMYEYLLNVPICPTITLLTWTYFTVLCIHFLPHSLLLENRVRRGCVGTWLTGLGCCWEKCGD